MNNMNIIFPLSTNCAHLKKMSVLMKFWKFICLSDGVSLSRTELEVSLSSLLCSVILGCHRKTEMIWKESRNVHLEFILGRRYTSYSDALRYLNIESLDLITGGNPCAWILQRIALKLTNSRKCSQKIQPAMTCSRGILNSIGHWQRYVIRSAIPQMQRMFNSYQKEIWKPSNI